MAEKMITIEEGLFRHGKLTEDEVLYVAQKVATYLAAVHERGELHLKLTPPAVFVDEQGHVQLEEGGRDNSSSSVHRLTLGFSAPEVLLGEEASTRTDVYKAGLLFHYLGSRVWPYKNLKRADQLSRVYSEPPFKKEPPFSEPLNNLVLRCQARNPDERFKDGKELLAVLTELLVDKFAGSEPPDLSRWLKGRPFPKFIRKPLEREPKKSTTVTSYAAILPLLIPLLLSLALVTFVLLQPKPVVPIENMRLKFLMGGVAVSGSYSTETLLDWKLSLNGKELKKGQVGTKQSGTFKIEIANLREGGVYILSLGRDQIVLGQLGFSLPKGRSR